MARGRALRGGVERDTRFLADNAVMDYSLLLGVHQGLLVLGIIGLYFLCTIPCAR